MVERPLRTGLTIIGVSLGVAAFIAVRTANVEVLRSFEQSVTAVSGAATLEIVGHDGRLDEALIAGVRHVPGIVSADPILAIEARFAGGSLKSQGISIVGVDLIEGNPHYAGKRAQEALLAAGPIPATIQRATQFHEFPEMFVNWTRKGDVAVVPPLLMQPVAVADAGLAAEVLAEVGLLQPGEPGRRLQGQRLVVVRVDELLDARQAYAVGKGLLEGVHAGLLDLRPSMRPADTPVTLNIHLAR